MVCLLWLASRGCGSRGGLSRGCLARGVGVSRGCGSRGGGDGVRAF